MNVKIFSPNDFPAYLPKLNSLYDDLFSGGKGFRSKLVQMVSDPLGINAETQTLLCQTIEFIHNASLLHDDLIDRSHLRRGKPAAWTKYTPEYAVLAGDYLLARVMVNLSGFGNIKLIQLTSETISDLLEGEWLQDSVVGDFFVNLEQLDRIHQLKTASLFKWCLRAPFIAQENYDQKLHHLLTELGIILGVLFQRADDLLDYNIRNDEGKAILGDLKSGYLNSFGAFVTKGMSRQQIDRLVKSNDLNDFYESLVNTELTHFKNAENTKMQSEVDNSSAILQGETIFKNKVAEFDEMNIKIIKLYEHYLEELQKIVNKPQLVQSLKPLTEILYWRRKPKSS